jgi:hypothetical protein
MHIDTHELLVPYARESYVIRRRDNFKEIRPAKGMKDNTLALRESEKHSARFSPPRWAQRAL